MSFPNLILKIRIIVENNNAIDDAAKELDGTNAPLCLNIHLKRFNVFNIYIPLMLQFSDVT